MFVKRFTVVFVIALLFLLGGVPSVEAANSQSLGSQHITGQSSSYDIYHSSWGRNTPFFDSDGKTVTEGIGLRQYSRSRSRVYASFKVDDYSYSTFETTVSLDNNYRVGARGKTEVVVYADNKLLYTETFTNTTPKRNLQLALPSNTKNITVFAIFKSGSQGTHRVILEKPRLTNSQSSISADETRRLSSIGVSTASSSYDWSFGANGGTPFEMQDGRLLARGYQLRRYSSNRARTYIGFPVSDYTYPMLETSISLDPNYASGDRGKTEVVVYADGYKLYTKTFTNNSPEEDLQLLIPKGTQTIYFYALFQPGSQGTHRVNIDNPTLTNSETYMDEANVLSLQSIGIARTSSSYDVNGRSWGSRPFELNDGRLSARGYGLRQYSRNRTNLFSTFYIGDQNYPTFETTISPDSRYTSGDRGSTKVQILADNEVLFEKNVQNNTQPEKINVDIPSGSEFLMLRAIVNPGSNGSHRIIFDDPVLSDGIVPTDATVPNTQRGFSDINEDYSFINEINFLTDQGIISGFPDGTFRTQNNITRQQAAIMIARAFDLDVGNRPDPRFTDVTPSITGYDKIAAVTEEGLFSEFITGTQFRPSQQLTRGEMASILAKAYYLSASSSNSNLTDIGTHWSRANILALAENNITIGYPDNTFRPNAPVTRVQFSIFMARAEEPSFRP